MRNKNWSVDYGRYSKEGLSNDEIVKLRTQIQKEKAEAGAETRAKLMELYEGEEQGDFYSFIALSKHGIKTELRVAAYNCSSGRALIVKGVTGDSMNVEKVTRTKMRCYTFDIMSQRTSWNFPLEDLELIKIER